MSSRVAATIAVPAFDAVRATPGAPFPDLRLRYGRMFFQIFSIIGEPGEVVAFDVMQGIGKCHFAAFVMVSVGFAVRRDVNDLRPGALAFVESGRESRRQIFSTFQQLFESDGL